jgi:hypothetical protein
MIWSMISGRVILRTVAGLTAVGGFVADWNRTHLFNPAWPPHAKFHDAWTISVGALLGGAALYLLRDGRTDQQAEIGAALPALFWVGQGSAFMFPGTAGLEAEFPQFVPRIKGVWINERFVAGAMLALSAAGYVMDRREAATRAGDGRTS